MHDSMRHFDEKSNRTLDISSWNMHGCQQFVLNDRDSINYEWKKRNEQFTMHIPNQTNILRISTQAHTHTQEWEWNL